MQDFSTRRGVSCPPAASNIKVWGVTGAVNQGPCGFYKPARMSCNIISINCTPARVLCGLVLCRSCVCVRVCVCVQRVRHGTGYLLLPSLFFSALGHKLHGSLSALRSAGAGLHPPAYTKGEPAPCLCECNVSSVPVCEKIGARSVPVRCPFGARCKKIGAR